MRKAILLGVFAIASCSTSNLEQTLKHDLKQNHSHGTIKMHEFSNKQISDYFLKERSNVNIYTVFADEKEKDFKETEAFRKNLSKDKKKFVIYLHNKGDNKIFSQYFEEGKDFNEINNVFKTMFPKPKYPETEILRIWKVDDTINSIQKSQAKEISYYQY